jgi:hypothetical protein
MLKSTRDTLHNLSYKRPQLTLRHRHARFDWSHDHLEWTIRTWRRVHWSDESRFLLRPADGRARVWCQRNTSFQDNHILGTTAFGGQKTTFIRPVDPSPCANSPLQMIM